MLPFRSVTRETSAGRTAVDRHFWAWPGWWLRRFSSILLCIPNIFSSQQSALVFDPSRSQGDPLGAFLVNVWEHLLAFGFRGDPTGTAQLPQPADAEPMGSVFFWLGVGMAVWRWQRPAYRLLLLWLGVLCSGRLLLSRDPPNTVRMIGAAPAIYLLAAVGVWEAFRFLRGRFFLENETKAAIAVGAVVSGLILIQGVLTYRTYFQKVGGRARTR